MRHATTLLLTSLLLIALAAAPSLAQRPELSNAVRAFVRVDAPLIALTGVTVIDGTGAPARAGQTVVLRDGLIEWVGPAAQASIPAGAEVLEVDVGRFDR